MFKVLEADVGGRSYCIVNGLCCRVRGVPGDTETSSSKRCTSCHRCLALCFAPQNDSQIFIVSSPLLSSDYRLLNAEIFTILVGLNRHKPRPHSNASYGNPNASRIVSNGKGFWSPFVKEGLGRKRMLPFCQNFWRNS